MSTFNDSHPRAGGTGPDRTQFAARDHHEATIELHAERLVEPMESAPVNGQVIEVLFEGDWYEVYWSDSAWDGSPHGTEGWKDKAEGLLMLDVEGWRRTGEDLFVDEAADREDYLREKDADAAEDARQDRKLAAARRRKTAARNREHLEARYDALFNEDVSGQKLTLAVLRARISAETNRRRPAALAEALRGFGF